MCHFPQEIYRRENKKQVNKVLEKLRNLEGET